MLSRESINQTWQDSPINQKNLRKVTLRLPGGFLLHECTLSMTSCYLDIPKLISKNIKAMVILFFYKHTDYSNTYLAIKRTASIYIRGVIFLALPPTRLSTTYEITPKAIPSEIEYINGIAKMQI